MFDKMTDAQICTYIDSGTKELEECITLDAFIEPSEKEFKMKMENKNFRSCMQGVFANFHYRISKQGIKWIIVQN